MSLKETQGTTNLSIQFKSVHNCISCRCWPMTVSQSHYFTPCSRLVENMNRTSRQFAHKNNWHLCRNYNTASDKNFRWQILYFKYVGHKNTGRCLWNITVYKPCILADVFQQPLILDHEGSSCMQKCIITNTTISVQSVSSSSNNKKHFTHMNLAVCMYIYINKHNQLELITSLSNRVSQNFKFFFIY